MHLYSRLALTPIHPPPLGVFQITLIFFFCAFSMPLTRTGKIISCLFVYCSDQNLTRVRIMTRVQRRERGETLNILIPESQPCLTSTGALNHTSEVLLPSEVIQLPESTRLRTECPVTWRLYPSPRQIELNFFESPYVTLSSSSSRAIY